MEGMRPRVEIRKLRPDATVPRYMSEHAAGLDISAAIDAPIAIRPGARETIGTGLAFSLPPGYEGQVRPRSGLALRHGLTMLNTPGTIDCDYRGEVAVLAINLGEAPVTIRRGDRIAQLVIAPVADVRVRPVRVLPGTRRGAGGFGHTGTR